MVREAIVFHIEGMVMGGEPLPRPGMSLEEAKAHHDEAVSEYAKETLDEFDGEGSEPPTTFGMVEVEVAEELMTAARAS